MNILQNKGLPFLASLYSFIAGYKQIQTLTRLPAAVAMMMDCYLYHIVSELFMQK
jgi:hypothetical protein